MSRPRRHDDRGSALVLAMFVLVLLTGMGTALLFLSQHETRMGRAALRAKQAFFVAEAGVEDGRATLFAINGGNSLDDDLAAAAGADLAIDFDPALVQPVFDGAGNVTGFSGFDDDVPVRPLTALAGSSGGLGLYAAYLTNDPAEGIANQTDLNDRVMITGLGAAAGGTFEVVQAIVEPFQFIPSVPAAALTLLGPDPNFDNGPSGPQSHNGDDCGIAGGAFAPIVGVIGSDSVGDVQDSMQREEDFQAGGAFVGENTVGDLTDPSDPIVSAAGHGTINPIWTDCEALKEMVETLEQNADYYCNADGAACDPPATASLMFIDGDFATPNETLSGILVVTGALDYGGQTEWNGIVLVIGEGIVNRDGGGNGNPSGAMVVANIDPTPDGPSADRSDWCSEPPDGFGSVNYEVNGGGKSTVQWCSEDLEAVNPIQYYRITEFLQR